MMLKKFCFILLVVISTGLGLQYPEYQITIPVFFLFGAMLLVFWLIIELLSRIFPQCYNCKGYGVTNQKRWQKPINLLIPGFLGKKCSTCNGTGIIKGQNEKGGGLL